MSKSLRTVFEMYVFAYVFLFSSRPVTDPDFWFHLKTGEYINQNGIIPRTELFSFTHYGKLWVAHGWLSGAIFYSIYSRLGLNFLIFLFAILSALAFWITLKRSNSHPFIGGLATVLGIWAVLPTIGVRPRVFTMLLASVFLALLNRYARQGEGRAVWWLVPLMGLWANLHGGFWIGLGLIILTIIGIPLDAWATGVQMRSLWPRLRTLGLVLFGCLLAPLLNPYGHRLYTFTLGVLLSPVFQGAVTDWLSPDFHESQVLPLALLILLTIAVLVFSPKRPRPSELLLFLATLYATLKAQRNLTIFVLVAVPLLADYLQSWLASTSFGKPLGKAPSSTSSRGAILLSMLLLLPLAVFVLKLKSTIYAAPTQEMTSLPVKAVEYLKEKQITGNTFTYPNIWGGYVLWALPSNPVYIDGRDVYAEDFVKEYLEVITGLRDWRGPFNHYGVQVVIVTTKSVLARELKDSSDWHEVFRDNLAVVFRRR